MKELLKQVVSCRSLSSHEAEAAMARIMAGEATPAQIAGLLVALRTKGETVAEIVAAARALQARATTTEASDPRTIDNCGTGGSGLDTFSISTTSAFVVAGISMIGVPNVWPWNTPERITTRSASWRWVVILD